MQFASTLATMLPLLATMAQAAPTTPINTLAARNEIPKECHFLNNTPASRKLICEYPTSHIPTFTSNIAGACVTDPTGAVDMVCKIPTGTKSFSMKNGKRAEQVEAYKFAVVCDDKGCHQEAKAARDLQTEAEEAYKLSIEWKRDVQAAEEEAYKLSIEWKRDEGFLTAREVAAAEEEAYKLSIEWKRDVQTEAQEAYKLSIEW
ncbi:hypothetical protein B0J14DRAFT_571816 [Halenospora varia]|nr:hypothetical protein B0J14DRAFT_571816 [Halenospora varia]